MKNDEPAVLEGDIVGFVFPVYYARIPVVVEKFLTRVRFEGKPYIFVIVNGGGLFGRTLKQVDTIIRAKKRIVNAGFRVGMPSNHPHRKILRRKKRNVYYKEERLKIEFIAKVILNGDLYLKEVNKGVLGAGISYLLGFTIPYEYSTKGILDKYFWLNERCVNCGACVEICPVENIIQTKRRPVWQHKCINCFACYNLCTWKAIQVSCPWKIFLFEDDFTQMPRYQHPELRTKDISGT
jgi:ferredoxin